VSTLARCTEAARNPGDSRTEIDEVPAATYRSARSISSQLPDSDQGAVRDRSRGDGKLRIDIYCRVIDHLGDIGVSLRLAGELARRGYHLRLFCDRPDLARALRGSQDASGDTMRARRCPSVAAQRTSAAVPDDLLALHEHPPQNPPSQEHEGPTVELYRWPAEPDGSIHKGGDGVAGEGMPGDGVAGDGADVGGGGDDSGPGSEVSAAYPAARVSAEAPQVIICAFGCELPAAVRRSLAPAGDDAPLHDDVKVPDLESPPGRVPRRPPLWLHLDYLSAEPWVNDFHGLASIKPDGARQIFVFPGFDPHSAGLPGSPPASGGRERAPALAIFAYAYAHAPLASWSASFARAFRASQPGRGIKSPPTTRLTIPAAHAGQWPALQGQLEAAQTGLSLLAPCTQEAFDRQLQSSDLLLVRGEDSWVLAMRSGLPWLWQPYPQESATLRRKLDALLERMQDCLGDVPGWDAWRVLLLAWGQAKAPPDAAIRMLMKDWPESQWHLLAMQWAQRCNAGKCLADGLADILRTALPMEPSTPAVGGQHPWQAPLSARIIRPPHES